MKKLSRFLLPITIAGVFGPLLAGLAVTVFAMSQYVIDPATALPVSDLPGLVIAYIIFAYVIGGPIALLAGLLVSIWMLWRQPSLLVAVAAAALATCIFMGVSATGALGPVQYTNAYANFLFILVCAVVAAAGCWLLTRPLARFA